MTLSIDSRIIRTAGVLETELDSEVALMSVKDGLYFSLNATASQIWHLLDREIEVQNLVECLGSQYEISQERCQVEILTLLNEMHQQGLVTVL